MEKIININIEKLPEGLYLATSDDVQGLVAQGRTIAKTMKIASDIAKKLLELQDNAPVDKDIKLTSIKLPIVVAF